jgi:thymidylate synthase ThyX
VWLRARDVAVEQADALVNLGVHKQHANRLLEPFCWHTVVVSSTKWENFFNLRCHPAAQPEMQIVAKLMRDAYNDSEPVELGHGEWHLPYVDYYVFDSEGSPYENPERKFPKEHQRALSVVRCAAVSYERQYADRTLEQVIARHDEMSQMAHWSPFEHQAFCGEDLKQSNFDRPWIQYRKTFHNEAVFRG